MFTRDSKILSHRLTTPLTSVANAVGDVFKPTYNQLIKSLFSNNEQGFAYDPNDLSTMFQDAAGTVPVTAVGQPVGLVLDKSRGLVLGSNLATRSSVVGAGVGGSEFKTVPVSLSLEIGAWYKITINVSNYSGSGDVGITGTSTAFPTSTIPTGIRSISSNGLISFIAEAKTDNTVVLYTRSSNNADFTNITIQKISGNHTYQTNAASRPLLQRNPTTGAYYLAFDGADDFLQTNNIDFTATDKVSLLAGVNVLLGASTGCVIELGTNATVNNGSFGLFRGPTTLQWASRGTSGVLGAVYGSASPPDALTAKAFINGSVLTVRRNSLLIIDNTQSQGTGNYGNYPLYIGRRTGTTLSFNGHIYGLIGIGKLTSDSETAAIEKELAKRTGATLNV